MYRRIAVVDSRPFGVVYESGLRRQPHDPDRQPDYPSTSLLLLFVDWV
jgi:hypothetical protein